MASERIAKVRQYAHSPLEWIEHSSGDHITLPLDAALLDDEAVRAAKEAWFMNRSVPFYEDRLRLCIAAYANHVAGGGA